MSATNATSFQPNTNPPPQAAPAPAARYEIDPAHSRASFAVRHMMVATVRGEFSNLSGTVVLDEADPSQSRVEAFIPAATVDTKVDMRNNHLKSADFFDVEKFPTIGFSSTEVATVSLNRKDFGLHWNQALDAGGVMVGDTVRVTIDLELARK